MVLNKNKSCTHSCHKVVSISGAARKRSGLKVWCKIWCKDLARVWQGVAQGLFLNEKNEIKEILNL
jgi:hypothetical protein